MLLFGVLFLLDDIGLSVLGLRFSFVCVYADYLSILWYFGFD